MNDSILFRLISETAVVANLMGKLPRGRPEIIPGACPAFDRCVGPKGQETKHNSPETR